MKRKRTRTIFFDVGWTLTHPVRSPWHVLSDICIEAGGELSPEASEAFVRDSWLQHQRHAMKRFHPEKEYSDSDDAFVGAFVRLGQAIFQLAGVEDSDGELFRRFFSFFANKENWRVFPDVPETLSRLREAGFRLAAISNASSDLGRFLDLLGVGQHFDEILISAVEGCRKPDRRIFERALERTESEPEETIHAGDLYFEDIVGAQNLGIRAVLVDRGRNAMFPSTGAHVMVERGEVDAIEQLDQIFDLISEEHGQ